MINCDRFSKSVFIEYNSTGILKIKHSDHSNMTIRKPSPDKLFRFERVDVLKDDDGKIHEKKSIKVALNGRFLEGLFRHMPVNYWTVEVNESSTRIVAIVYDGHEDIFCL